MTQQRTQLLLLAAFALVVGGWYWSQRGGTPSAQPSSEVATNGAMLAEESAADVEIVVDPAVAYFPGATGYFARPAAGGQYPGVVTIHENRGVRPEIRTMAEDLAREGYAVLAVDLFGGKVVDTQDEARALTAALDQTVATENLRAAAAYLREHGSAKVASLGWCFGGGQSLQLALSGEPMDATVIYYGRLVTEPEKLRAISWPVLGIFGDKDQAISVESVRDFDAALDEIGVRNEIHLYPGVGHAFANPSGANYAPAETRDAWEKTVDFLNSTLGE
jgi:carboxymethylenebutenolidase